MPSLLSFWILALLSGFVGVCAGMTLVMAMTSSLPEEKYAASLLSSILAFMIPLGMGIYLAFFHTLIDVTRDVVDTDAGIFLWLGGILSLLLCLFSIRVRRLW